MTEIGKVSFPESSGTLTKSLVICLQLLQTPAQATTFFLGGQLLSDSSILTSTSLNNSCGKLAQHEVVSTALPSPKRFVPGAELYWTTLCDLDLLIMLLIAGIFGKSETFKVKEELGFSSLVLLERDLGLGYEIERESDGVGCGCREEGVSERERETGARNISCMLRKLLY